MTQGYQHVLLISYHGTIYHGLQLQKQCGTTPKSGGRKNDAVSGCPNKRNRSRDDDVPSTENAVVVADYGNEDDESTVDSYILRALQSSGLVHSSEPRRIGYFRSSRTDKGVHALRNVISVRLPRVIFDTANLQELRPLGEVPEIQKETATRVLSLVNASLPSFDTLGGAIRVHAITPVPKNFRVRENCRHRTYYYFFPVDVLDGSWEGGHASHGQKESHSTTESLIKDFNMFAQSFVGTFQVHNLCCEKERIAPNTNQAYRTLSRCELLYDSNLPVGDDTQTTHFSSAEGTTVRPYVTCVISGQSFVMHMIRKLMGLLISCVRRKVALDVLEKVRDPKMLVCVPLAPSGNLYLHTLTFPNYDSERERVQQTTKRCDRQNSMQSQPMTPPPVESIPQSTELEARLVEAEEETFTFPPLGSTWAQCQGVLDMFEQSIQREIQRVELQEDAMAKFARSLQWHSWRIRPRSYSVTHPQKVAGKGDTNSKPEKVGSEDLKS